jgi:class 3 adenylate cyclase
VIARTEYERARAVLERAGPSEALANAYIRLAGLHMFDYQFEECLAMATRATEVAAAAGVESARIWASVFVGGALADLGQLDEGFRIIDAAHSEAAALGLIGIASNALYNGSITRIIRFRAREGLDRLKLFESLRVSNHPTHLELYATAVGWHCLGYPGRARELEEQALTLTHEAQAYTFEVWIRRALGLAIGALGDPVEGLKVFGPVDPKQELQDLVLGLRHLMRLQLDAGDIAGAEVHALTVYERADWGSPFDTRELGDTAVEVLIHAGRLDEAEQIVGRARDGDVLAQPYQDRMEGRLAVVKGDLERASAMLMKAISGFEGHGYALEEMRTRRSLAAAHLKAGDREAAEAELRTVVRIADEHGAVFEGNQARLALGIPLSPSATSLSPSGERVRERGAKEAEERVVTVMFADVRGYTQMAANEAPADLVDKVASFHRWARQEVERHHGVVDKYAGDAVMATFNVSGAKLDHTLQAVQAALAIRDKANAAGLPVGIGIAVGAAVVGSLTADANMSAIGEVTNLASRLQGQAAAGELMLSEEAYKRTREWLAEHSLRSSEESLTVKGFPEPVPAHRLGDLGR